MKIKTVSRKGIYFSNGDVIKHNYEPECCEWNYADYAQLDKEALDIEFNPPITLEGCKYGFRFGNPPGKMYFVPCYSVQNGYYSRALDILCFNKHKDVIAKIGVSCKWIE